jgi:hypothetical protein
MAALAFAATATPASGAVVALPRVSAETTVTTYRGVSTLRVRSLLVRELHGTLRVTCNRCRRLTTKIRVTRPTTTSKRFAGVNWLLGRGRVIRVAVTRKGYTGRFLLLAARTRGKRGLIFRTSGCLDRRRRTVRCPRGTPQPAPGAAVPAAPPAAAAPRVSAAGVVRGNEWFLTGTLGGDVTRSFGYGNPGDIPLLGDWNGDGVDTPGVVRAGLWYLTNTFGDPATISFGYGNPGDIPVVGDWNGDGIDTPGVVRDGLWYLSNSFGEPTSLSFGYGNPGDVALAGDWNGDGIDTPGVVRGNLWYLTNTFGDATTFGFAYGNPGFRVLAGDWNGDGIDTPGVVDNAHWYLTDTFGDPSTHAFVYGNPGDIPLAGKTSPP